MSIGEIKSWLSPFLLALAVAFTFLLLLVRKPGIRLLLAFWLENKNVVSGQVSNTCARLCLVQVIEETRLPFSYRLRDIQS